MGFKFHIVFTGGTAGKSTLMVSDVFLTTVQFFTAFTTFDVQADTVVGFQFTSKVVLEMVFKTHRSVEVTTTAYTFLGRFQALRMSF